MRARFALRGRGAADRARFAQADIAGHVEAHELASPAAACLREVAEETGIQPADITGLALRYFALCRTPDTLDSIYYFVGELARRHPLPEMDEGTLHWVAHPDADGLYCRAVGTDGYLLAEIT